MNKQAFARTTNQKKHTVQTYMTKYMCINLMQMIAWAFETEQIE